MLILSKYRDKQNEYDTLDIRMESHALTLPEILNDIELFLQACGYPIERGSLHISKEEDT